MTSRTMRRFVMVLLALGVSLAIVGVPAPEEACAVPCCSECDARLNSCLNSTSTPPCFGDVFCCFDLTRFCYSHCVRCF
jgi:hypothetical protein